MEKINFVNNDAPYLSAENLNQMQNNIESAINEVIESGNNNNGSYIKYADGTLKCYGITTITSAKPNTTTEKVVNLPYNFINTNYTVSLQKTNSGAYWGSINEQTISKTNNTFTITCWNSASETSGIINYDYVVVGKWK